MHNHTNQLPLSTAVFTAFLCMLFGANTVAIKVSLSGLGIFATAGIRFTIASLAIFLWAKMTRQSFAIRKGQAAQLILMSSSFTVQLSLIYFGLSKTDASRCALLVNLQPFLILFLAHYFIPGDRITKRKLFGMLLGFAGVAFVFMEKKTMTTDFRIGDMLILISMVISACSIIYIKRIIREFNTFHIAFYPMTFSAPLFFVESVLWDPAMIIHISPEVLFSILYQSLVVASFGFVAWTTLLRKYDAAALHSFVFIVPVTGVLLGGLLLGEPVTFRILAALVLIVSGILVIHFRLEKLTFTRT